jgi:hypothetical protein
MTIFPGPKTATMRVGFGFEHIEHNLFNGGTILGSWTFGSIRDMPLANLTQFTSTSPTPMLLPACECISFKDIFMTASACAPT